MIDCYVSRKYQQRKVKTTKVSYKKLIISAILRYAIIPLFFFLYPSSSLIYLFPLPCSHYPLYSSSSSPFSPSPTSSKKLSSQLFVWTRLSTSITSMFSSPHNMLKLTEIYDWILERYPLFNENKTGFQNSIRHNLSLNRIFVKVGFSWRSL